MSAMIRQLKFFLQRTGIGAFIIALLLFDFLMQIIGIGAWALSHLLTALYNRAIRDGIALESPDPPWRLWLSFEPAAFMLVALLVTYAFSRWLFGAVPKPKPNPETL